MEKLEALNMILRATGNTPVNSLDTAHPNAKGALTAIDRVTVQAQKRGWWFNIDYNVTYTLDELGNIPIPSTVTKIVFKDPKLVIRNNKLYDNKEQTYVFLEAKTANRVQYALSWEEVPESLQEYVAYKATAQFVRDDLGDQVVEQSFKEDAAISYLDLRKEDLEQGQYNVFSIARVQRARYGVRPYGLNTL